MQKSISGIFIALLALTGIFLTACSETGPVVQGDNQTKTDTKELKTYKIGFIGPLSGDAAAVGTEAQKILDYRLKEINEAAAKDGYKFEIVYEDGKCAGADSVTAFQKLADTQNISVFIGGVCSSETLSIAPLLADKNAIAVSFGSSNPDVEGKSPNLFDLSYNDNAVGQGIAAELGKYKKVALLNEQNEYNAGIKRVVEKTLKEKYPDVQIVSNEDLAKGSTDFRNALQKIKASGAEAVLLNPNAGVTAQALLAQLAEIKDWKAQNISQIAYIGEDTIKSGPQAAEGMIVVDAPNITDEDFLNYRAKIVSDKGTLENIGIYYTASTLDALNILAEEIHKNDGDAMKIKADLATGSFDGNIGQIKFNGHTFWEGSSVAARYIIKDGKAVKQ